MKQEKTIFSPAKILLPLFSGQSDKMNKWSVIACDQFTSQIEYWTQAESIVENHVSTYQYILPEAYLGTEKEDIHNAKVKQSMSNFLSSDMKLIDGFIYLERKLPNGKVRHGLIGKIDLEKYDYTSCSKSPIRATESTVIERIPPRQKIRKEAVIEFPHILILITDKIGFFNELKQHKDTYPLAYSFELMLGGGYVTGYEITGSDVLTIQKKIDEYEKTTASVVYAMGDGNHSLAAAKSHWESIKKETGNINHPARYALCEITALEDESLEFEPIYRILQNCDIEAFLHELSKHATEEVKGQKVTVITKEKSFDILLTPSNDLTVGTLQDIIDEYILEHNETICDYIHGIDTLKSLSENENSIGFILEGIKKDELFNYVAKNGALPRKTFSMGEAESKRYYLEARKIIL